MMDGYHKLVAVIYCFVIIVLTAEFTINLILAVFVESFTYEKEMMEKEQIDKYEIGTNFEENEEVEDVEGVEFLN